MIISSDFHFRNYFLNVKLFVHYCCSAVSQPLGKELNSTSSGESKGRENKKHGTYLFYDYFYRAPWGGGGGGQGPLTESATEKDLKQSMA